jgi:DNA-binding NtrC family response regulator
MLAHCGWNQREAAGRLKIGYNTLWRKIKEYGLERETT